jgi:hypothetical protein
MSEVRSGPTRGAGSGRVPFQGAFANFNLHAAIKIDFGNDDAPLLIGGELDHTVPAVVIERWQSGSRRSRRRSRVQGILGRSHFIIGQRLGGGRRLH